MNIKVHTYVHTYVCIKPCTYVRTYIRTSTLTYHSTYVHTYLRTYFHTHIHSSPFDPHSPCTEPGLMTPLTGVHMEQSERPHCFQCMMICLEDTQWPSEGRQIHDNMYRIICTHVGQDNMCLYVSTCIRIYKCRYARM